MILAIPVSRWGEVPYVVDPIPFPCGILSSVVPASHSLRNDKQPLIHPYDQARLWRLEMDRDSEVTKAKSPPEKAFLGLA